ncbi:ABC transporter ATP-binding protein [Viridibacterium curvum]|uniref:ABC transporter ATP-binding protein n=1 Tax=Viridibacterium curvum TaxID=1101404 RepID=A0ABP9QP88_9RHOO
MSASPVLSVENLHLAYGKHEVVHGASFQLQQGSIACLLGPSGCGKTSILRAIAGFEPVRDGEIHFDGRRIAASDLHLAPEARRIGMVFQDYALFPHLTVADNIAFGLRDMDRAARAARVAEMLALIGLPDIGTRYPHELSGGQQQRIALARALAPHPALILLDEPFSNLDVDLRERLSLEVRDILKRAGTTAILVTHDQHEAFAMADEIGVMSEGRIRQWDTPYRLYHEPADRFVADFVGQGVFVKAEVLSRDSVRFELGELHASVPRQCDIGCERCERNCPIEVLLRPDDIIHDDASDTKAEVVAKAFRGSEFLYTLRLPSGQTVLSLVPSHHNHAIGEAIGIRLDVDHVVTFAS